MEKAWTLVNPYTGAPITGGAANTALRIRRVADNFLYDFADSTFKAAGWGTVAQALTEVSAANVPGTYAITIDPALWNDGDYHFYAAYTGTPALYAESVSRIEDGVESVITGTNNDKTGYALTAGEHTLISGTDVPAALTAQGYTTTRAGYLDTLNGLVTAIWSAGTRTLTSFGFDVTLTSAYDAAKTAATQSSVNALGTPMQAGAAVTVATNTDKTGYTLTTGEHILISGTDVPAALTAHGLTTTRAAYLDTLNGLIANIWASATRTLTAFSFSVTASTVSDKTGYSLDAAYDAAKTAASQTSVNNLGSPMQAGASVTVATNNDKTGYALTSGEHIAIAADTQTGLTAQGYTTTRAGYLDTLNGLVANIWAAATRTLTSYGTLAADVWNAATRTLTAFGFDVTLTSAYDSAKTAASQLSVTALGSPLQASAYTAPDNAGIAAIQAKTDNLPNDPASNTTVLTRLAATDYTAPDNATIADIYTDTQALKVLLGGAGAYVIALQIYETATTTPIQDVHVSAYDDTDTLSASGTTDASGQVSFALNAGDYVIRLRKTGIGFAIEELTVTDDATVTIYGEPAVIPTPISGDACVVYEYCYDQASQTPLASVTATAQILNVPFDAAGKLHERGDVAGTYDENTGIVSWEIVQGATVQIRIPDVGVNRRITIPATTTARLTDITE